MSDGKRLRIGENKENRMEMMTFEEIWTRKVETPVDLEEWTRETVRLARVGTVPENECVRLPRPDVWPDYATSVVVLYSSQDEKWHTEISRIPRPAPAWTPKVGDKVFHKAGDTIGVGIVSHKDSEGYCALNGKNGTHWKNIKPFATEHIGKPWENIPNAQD